MNKKHVNENYTHNCGSTQEDVLSHKIELTKMGFTNEQVIEILEFYLFNAPVLKPDKTDIGSGLMSLKDYGWVGAPDLSKLEGRILKAAGIGFFCFIKCNSIANTLEAMNLGEKICTEHPRAVLMQNSKITLFEDSSINISDSESRMLCLFRHLRNAIAHNRTYLFENGNILLEDLDENGRISARILAPKQILTEWMTIVRNKN